jgi:hypothetical protein
MSSVTGALQRLSDFWAVFLVAVAVVVASTLAGAWLDHLHQVNAEDMTTKTSSAVPGPNGYQTLTISEWGVQLELPLADELPTVSYGSQGGSSIGLSSADVEKLGPACAAGRNALGAVVRMPRGSFAAPFAEGTLNYFIATIGEYDYAYQISPTACIDQPGENGTVNRETSIIREAVGSLRPVGN